ncbi:MAG: hypothetical protein ABSG16_14620 [Candidatus Acidiferrum sp.]|jgi:transcriptional regulator with XRE-family HTH domain
MERDKEKDNTMGLPALELFRGLYNRVAGKLGVDPSYVSRVARGERRSAPILAALEEEMAIIREHLNNHLDGKRVDGHQDGKMRLDGHLDGKMRVDGNASTKDGKKVPVKRANSGPAADGVPR